MQKEYSYLCAFECGIRCTGPGQSHPCPPYTPACILQTYTYIHKYVHVYIYTLGSPALPPPAHPLWYALVPPAVPYPLPPDPLPRLPRSTAAASDGSGGPTTKVLVCCWLFAAVALCMLSHRVHVLFGSPQMFDILKVKREHNKRLYQTAAPGWINYCPCFMLCVIYALDENAPSCPFLLQ